MNDAAGFTINYTIRFLKEVILIGRPPQIDIS